MQKRLRLLAIILLIFNGLGALWGGAGLIYDPTGKFMQMPLEMIKHAPFKDYLIPGIILLFFNGILSISIAVITIRKLRFYPQLIIIQGLVLVGWLTIQILMIQMFYWPLHGLFYVVAIALVGIGYYIHKLQNHT